jgi:aspartate/tyrosine/aromatic aminotransferase
MLSPEAWNAIAAIMSWRGLIALVDLAYQGFGHGLDENGGGVRLHALRLLELLVAISGRRTSWRRSRNSSPNVLE